MIDVRRYKLNPPTALAWPTGAGTIHARAISLHHQQLADVLTTGPVQRMAHELAAGIVEDITGPELLAALTSAQLVDLYDRWFDAVQVFAWPHVDRLIEWLRRSVNDCPGVIADGTLASHVSLTEYHPDPVRDLTPAQVVWYLGLRAAYEEFHHERIDDMGRTRPPKSPTKWWLRQGEPLEARQEWLMKSD